MDVNAGAFEFWAATLALKVIPCGAIGAMDRYTPTFLSAMGSNGDVAAFVPLRDKPSPSFPLPLLLLKSVMGHKVTRAVVRASLFLLAGERVSLGPSAAATSATGSPRGIRAPAVSGPDAKDAQIAGVLRAAVPTAAANAIQPCEFTVLRDIHTAAVLAYAHASGVVEGCSRPGKTSSVSSTTPPTVKWTPVANKFAIAKPILGAYAFDRMANADASVLSVPAIMVRKVRLVRSAAGVVEIEISLCGGATPQLKSKVPVAVSVASGDTGWERSFEAVSKKDGS